MPATAPPGQLPLLTDDPRVVLVLADRIVDIVGTQEKAAKLFRVHQSTLSRAPRLLAVLSQHVGYAELLPLPSDSL